MGGQKNQHIIPAFHLKMMGYKSGMESIPDKKDKVLSEINTATGICREKALAAYDVLKEDNYYDLETDKKLQLVENNAARVFKKLAMADYSKKRNFKITKVDGEVLHSYAHQLFLRTDSEINAILEKMNISKHKLLFDKTKYKYRFLVAQTEVPLILNYPQPCLFNAIFENSYLVENCIAFPISSDRLLICIKSDEDIDNSVIEFAIEEGSGGIAFAFALNFLSFDSDSVGARSFVKTNEKNFMLDKIIEEVLVANYFWTEVLIKSDISTLMEVELSEYVQWKYRFRYLFSVENGKLNLGYSTTSEDTGFIALAPYSQNDVDYFFENSNKDRIFDIGKAIYKLNLPLYILVKFYDLINSDTVLFEEKLKEYRRIKSLDLEEKN